MTWQEELDELTSGVPGRDTWALLTRLFRQIPSDEREEAAERVRERTRTWPDWTFSDAESWDPETNCVPTSLIRSHANEVQDDAHQDWFRTRWPTGARLTRLHLIARSAKALAGSGALGLPECHELRSLRLQLAVHSRGEAGDGDALIPMLLEFPLRERLELLDLSETRLGPRGLRRLAEGRWPALRHLVLSRNPLGGVEPLLALEGLETLELKGCQLSMGDVEVLAGWRAPRLRSLNLALNALPDAAAFTLASARGLPALQVLNLAGNAFGSAGLRALASGRAWARVVLAGNPGETELAAEELPSWVGLPRTTPPPVPVAPLPPAEATQGYGLLADWLLRAEERLCLLDEGEVAAAEGRLKAWLETLPTGPREAVEDALVERLLRQVHPAGELTYGLPRSREFFADEPRRGLLRLLHRAVLRRCLGRPEPERGELLLDVMESGAPPEALAAPHDGAPALAAVRALSAAGWAAAPLLLDHVEDPRPEIRAAAVLGLHRLAHDTVTARREDEFDRAIRGLRLPDLAGKRQDWERWLREHGPA